MTRPLFRDLSFLARFFVFTLVFSLSLPAVADAFLTRGGKPQPLEAARKAEEERRAEEEVRKLQERAKSAGFIAISDTSMTWADAKTFCQQQGGKLPLIGGKEALGSEAYTQGVSIDGFGRSGASWPAGLPRGDYWTGTQGTDGPGFSWIVGVYGGVVSVTNCLQSNQRRVVCVP